MDAHFLRQAKKFVEDGDADIALASTVVLCYQGCLSAMDPILAAAGRRVTSGTESHVVRIRECRGLLGNAYADLLDRMDEWRRERGDVSYGALDPSAKSVAALQSDARDLLA